MNNAIKRFWIIAVMVMALVFGMTAVGCAPEEETYDSPEDMPEAKRWGWAWDDESTAKIDFSADKDGLCTVNVTGTAEKDRHKAHVAYMYTQKEGASYVYTFDAWTKEGNRTLSVNYFENNDDRVWLTQDIQITSTQKTFTIYGGAIPRLGEYPALRFQCADKLGTFYIKIREIKEYTTGKLTITISPSDFVKDSYIDGYLRYNDENDDPISLYFGASGESAFQMKANTFTLTAFKRLEDKDGNYIISPFTGNTTAEPEALLINYMHDDRCAQYLNTKPITFTNGNASINFGEQMVYVGDWTPDGGGSGGGSDSNTDETKPPPASGGEG